ncbi:MAG: helix-hairpin-helix domain-containing protein [Marinilabiliaceae bacterium]|nr:helix-hairpin-helix domain-containing protein [Marinilabiliaceae bacterium]
MWRDYLAFSKKQRLGFWTLSTLILLHIIYLFFFVPYDSNSLQLFFSQSEDTIVKTRFVDISGFENAKLNPNNASINDLEQLGFSSRAILNLKKYLENGGRISSLKQLKTIYGIDTVLVNQLSESFYFDDGSVAYKRKYKPKHKVEKKYIPKWLNLNNALKADLISIGFEDKVVDSIEKIRENLYIETVQDVNSFLANSSQQQLKWVFEHSKKRYKPKSNPNFKIDINTADTNKLKLFRGIGSGLSNRIINYRNKLGGFYNIMQLKEVYGITDELINSIDSLLTIDTSKIRTINVNKATVRKMKDHPYIGFYLAQEIYEYRKVNGPVLNYEKLQELKSIEKSDFIKLKYYLSY